MMIIRESMPDIMTPTDVTVRTVHLYCNYRFSCLNLLLWGITCAQRRVTYAYVPGLRKSAGVVGAQLATTLITEGWHDVPRELPYRLEVLLCLLRDLGALEPPWDLDAEAEGRHEVLAPLVGCLPNPVEVELRVVLGRDDPLRGVIEGV